MEYDIHTVLDGLTLIATAGVIFCMVLQVLLGRSGVNLVWGGHLLIPIAHLLHRVTVAAGCEADIPKGPGPAQVLFCGEDQGG